MESRLFIAALFGFFANCSIAGNCEQMAEMAKDISNLRDAGVPITAVEARLKQDVPDPTELGMATIVVRLVYKTRGTGEQLKREVLKKCNK